MNLNIFGKDEHFALFEKPIKSKSMLKKASYMRDYTSLDYVVEYFKFEENKKRGWNSEFLTKNPYEGEFYDFVMSLEKKFNYLPEEESRRRVLEAIKYKRTLALEDY